MSIKNTLHLSVVVLILIHGHAFGQKSLEIELRNNFVTLSDQSFGFSSTQNTATTTYELSTIGHSLDAIVWLNMESGVFHRVRSGYQYGSSGLTTLRESPDGERIDETNFSSSWGMRLAYGFGKEISIGKLQIRPGVEAFVHLNTNRKGEVQASISDSLGNSLESMQRTTIEPGQKALGVGVFIGAYYKLWKGLSIGMTQTSLFQYSFIKGDKVEKYLFYDANGTETDRYTRTVSNRLNSFRTYFLHIAISLTYRIPMKKKKTAEPIE